MIDEFYLIVLPFTKVKQYAFFRYREQYDLSLIHILRVSGDRLAVHEKFDRKSLQKRCV